MAMNLWSLDACNRSEIITFSYGAKGLYRFRWVKIEKKRNTNKFAQLHECKTVHISVKYAYVRFALFFGLAKFNPGGGHGKILGVTS